MQDASFRHMVHHNVHTGNDIRADSEAGAGLIVVTAQIHGRQKLPRTTLDQKVRSVKELDGDDLSMMIGEWYSYGILCYCVNRRILKER